MPQIYDMGPTATIVIIIKIITTKKKEIQRHVQAKMNTDFFSLETRREETT